jgi:uncharacterized protein
MTMTGAPVLGRMLWYELLTTDPGAAQAFYRTVVGWTVTPFEESPDPYDMWTRADGVPIGGVMKIPDSLGAPPHWRMFVGVPRLEDAVAHVERLGGRAQSDAIAVPTVGRMRFMNDPQGALFALYEPASPPDAPEAAPQTGDVSWHELYTTDVEAAMAFYTDIFGWRPTEALDMGPAGTYHMFGRAHPLGGMMNKTPEMAMVPTSWNLYFHVPDVHAAADVVKANGGQVLNGPMEVPGGDWIVNCLDPQGAAFSLHQSKT